MSSTWRPWHLLRIVLCMLLLAPAWSGAATGLRLGAGVEEIDLSPRVQVIEDASGALDLAGARAAFAAGGGHTGKAGQLGELNFGYHAAAIWLHTTVAADEAALGRWLVEVDFPTLDRVEFYTVGADGSVRARVAGDLVALAERPWHHRNPVFPLELTRAGEPVAVYMRVKSEGSLTIPLRLWTETALAARDQRAYAGDALYCGMLLALTLYNLLLWLSLRERVFLRYVGFVGSLAIGFAGQTGIGGQFLWPAWPAWANVSFPLGMALTGLFGALFTRSFLDTRNTVPVLDRLIAAFAWVFAAAVLAHAVSGYRVAAMLTSLAGLGFAPIAGMAGVRCARRKHPGGRVFLLAWALLLVGVAVMALRNFGLLPTLWLTTHAMQIGSALEMLLLSFAMADRIHAMRREREAARQAMVDTLREAGHQLESRVAARTAELEAANRRLRENELALQQLAFHDPLTGLFNRVMLEDRLRHAMQRAERRQTQLAVLLIDLDGFKAINDNHGHAEGDRVLAAVAARMRAQVRASDTLARLGGDEFVVVLEPFAGEDEAMRVAAKLVAALTEPITDGERPCRIGASIGIALYPQDGNDVDALVLAADRAMYRAKASGKGGWQRAPRPEPARPVVGQAEAGA